MNLITEYASRPGTAAGLFKTPSSIVAMTEENSNGKVILKPRVMTFSDNDKKHISVKLYGIGSGELPELFKEKTIPLKDIFVAGALGDVFEKCRMMPYIFAHYPAEVVYNDPPQSHEQEESVKKYFQTIYNSTTNREYRKMLIWCSFITDNCDHKFLSANGRQIREGTFYIRFEIIKEKNKDTWNKWKKWCDYLYLVSGSEWANEILFAKCLPRMKKEQMSAVGISVNEISSCEDVELAA